MIKSYGLHWHEKYISWGWPKHKGTLLGAASRSKHASKVDFRDQRGVYALFAEYELVYIGQTGAKSDRLFNRLKTHKNDHLSERWNRFSWFGLQWVTKDHFLSKDIAANKASTVEVLNILEAITIAISEPRLNLQRGRWSGSTQYFQFIEGEDQEDENYE